MTNAKIDDKMEGIIVNQVEALVEIPKGSRNKYEFDKKLGRIRLDRVLYSPLHYPADYGFILNTLAEDETRWMSSL